MQYSIEQIIQSIREARQRKGLSQKALGQKVGLPQSHISKIEKGSVDLKTSSLIEMARVLDLEPMLIPRVVVPAVEYLQNSVEQKTVKEDRAPRPAYLLEEEK